jgi:hypothetical protein
MLYRRISLVANFVYYFFSIIYFDIEEKKIDYLSSIIK